MRAEIGAIEGVPLALALLCSGFMAPSIHFGPDVLSAFAEALKARGVRRVFMITGSSRRFADRLLSVIEATGADVQVFDGAVVHVPVEVVDKAKAEVERFVPDALVSLGGGAATGLAKALRRSYDAAFFAVPTTFSASEMTSIYGTTDGGHKQTGRDDRARPDAVFYDAEFVQGLPLSLKITSLLNALAHPVSSLSTETLDDAARARALDAIRLIVRAALQLAETPTQREAHEDGLKGASRAGQVLDSSKLGEHHRWAHFLGGRFALEHSGLHAVLLPHSLRRLRDERPELYQAIEDAAQVPDLSAQLFDLLRRAQAKTSLRDMGVSWSALHEALDAESDFPKDVLRAVFLGRRPSAHSRWEDWGLRQPVTVAGVPLARADTVVVAVHGRGVAAETIVQRAFEVGGHRPGLSVVAPQAPDNHWYTAAYRDAPATIGVPLVTALDELDKVVERVRNEAPTARVVVFGFSQGACLAAEFVATRSAKAKVDALIGFVGARFGPAGEYSGSGGSLAGTRVLLSASRGDPWVTFGDIEATAKWFEEAGADVELMVEPSDEHRLAQRPRLRAHEIIAGAPRGVLRGFGNAHETEALPGALPLRQNSPRRVKYGLYSEQINGTGFVAHRHENLRSWTYRVRPAAQHTKFEPLEHPTFRADFGAEGLDPNLLGYAPLAIPETPTDFIDGMATFGGAGGPTLRRGFALHLYTANRSMEDRAFSNADGDLLIVPQAGALTVVTEMGVLALSPGQVMIIPRGIKFSVLLNDGEARGYVAETYGRHFELPERGPVGANGLTDPRHFVSPTAWYEDRLAPGYRLTNKFSGRLYDAQQDYSPYDVVAWHGNYTPYVYDLMDFGPVSNVRFDHPDPSIYTVLSVPMDEVGSNTLDFVFFPPRWDVTEETFRPPFFHKNATTEFNGIIQDPAGHKPPFYAGGYFMTPSMTPHGVMSDSVLRTFVRKDDPPPHRSSESSMWFQFESALPIAMTPWALQSANRMQDWHLLWGTYRTHFDPYEED